MKIIFLLIISSIFTSNLCFAKDKSAAKIKYGVLPTGDCFPISFALEKGIFEKHGVNVELLKFRSAMERDSAFAAGTINGANSDLVGASLKHHAFQNVSVVALALGDSTDARGAVLLTMDHAIDNAAKLEGKTIAVSYNTVIEYLADRLLSKASVDITKVKKQNIPNIQMRLMLTKEKNVQGTILPDPLAAYGENILGGKVLVEDKESQYSHAILTFDKDFLNSNKDSVKRFLAAVEEVSNNINKDPESYRERIVQDCLVPYEIRNTFKVSHYSIRKLPSRSLFADVQDWLEKNKKINKKLLYDEMVFTEFGYKVDTSFENKR